MAQEVPYRLQKQNGLWLEQYPETDTIQNKYTANNELYPEGASFTYRYYLLDSTGQPFLQKVVSTTSSSREKAWKLIPLAARDSLTNDRLRLIIESDYEGISATVPAYNHTPIRWEYTAPAGTLHFLEQYTLIENRKTIWLHPPHARLFSILALNPFPYVETPLKQGRTWEWQQQIPASWGDARWREWSGTLSVYHRYTLAGEEMLQTPFGLLNCWLIKATGTSRLGNTALNAYYHPQYGFVRLHFVNIDSSELILELVDKQ